MYQAMGTAIIIAIRTSFTKLSVSRLNMLLMEAPNTSRMLISLPRCSTMKAERANRPRQATMTAKTAKVVKIRPMRFTSSYIRE